jgi:tripeptide aminopeptidase
VNPVDRARLTEDFLELVSIPSPSRREGQVARRLEAMLRAMGASVEVDAAGEAVGADTGNLVARFPGTVSGAPPFLLSGHMDTVGPAERIRARLDGDVVRTDGSSVLGGDDKAGIAAILEAVRVVRERGLPHGDIEIVLTICEELGLLGVKQLDTGRLRARRGLVLDVDGVAELVVRAPAANRLSVRIRGLEAHAGICPERGLSSIRIAAEAIASMRLGRIDAETTANLGVIRGGLGSNIVPAEVVVHGEARSLDAGRLAAQTAHMRERFEAAAARHAVVVDGVERRAAVEVAVDPQYERLDLAEDAPVVRLVTRAAAAAGRRCPTRATGGGSDANVLAARGLEVANLACGMRDIHTVHEWADVRDLVSTAEILVQVLTLNAAGA